MKKLLLLTLLLLIPVAALPQATLAPVAVQQFFDATGSPLAGGTVSTYAAGTTTPLATYTDQSGTTAAPNPIVLDSGGYASIWLGSGSYKFVVAKADGTIISTTDNITADGGSGGSSGFGAYNTANCVGASAAARIDACITLYASSSRAIFEIPATEAFGWGSKMTSFSRFIDYRGTSESNAYGIFNTGNTSAYSNGIFFYSAETQQANTSVYQAFTGLHIHQYAKSGGVYNYKGASGTKTDYMGLEITGEYRTPAQHQTARFDLGNFAVGDSVDLLVNNYYIGGFGNNGDEGATGVRTAVQQIGVDGGGSSATGGALSGTLGAITGSGPYTVAYTVTQSGDTIGAWRLIRDLGSVYSTGTISAIANNTNTPISGVTTVTITGSGTSWSTLGVGSHTTFIDNTVAQGYLANGTNLVICFDWLTHDTYDFCVPITAIASDTSLTINLYAGGTVAGTQWANMATTGTYRIYGAAWPNSVDKELLTFTTSDVSKITAGHSFDQVISAFSTARNHYNWWSRKIGIPFTGNSYYAANLSSSGAASPFAGVQMVGNWHFTFMADGTNNASGASDAFFVTLNDPSSTSNYAVLQNFYNPLATGIHNVYGWHGLDGTNRFWLCNRQTLDYCSFGGASISATPGLNNGQFAIGQAPVANIAAFIGFNGAGGLNPNGIQIQPGTDIPNGNYVWQARAAGGGEIFGLRSLGAGSYGLNLVNGTHIKGWSGGVSGSSYTGNTYDLDASTGNLAISGTMTTGSGTSTPFQILSLDQSGTPSAPAASNTAVYTKGGLLCAENPSGAERCMQGTAITTTAYTNATTTFSTVTGTTTLSFAVAANTNYVGSCYILWQGSAGTTGPKFQLTGPASPTAVSLSMDSAVTSTTSIYASATAFSSAVANSGTITSATNFPAHLQFGIVNGANAGTVVLQAAANGVGTLTIQPGSYCTIQ